MGNFADNDIISLTQEMPIYDLAESVGPDLTVADLLDEKAFEAFRQMKLSYGTAEGGEALRAKLAAIHGVTTQDVITTVGAMHALFLLAFLLCDEESEVVTTEPLFPLARNVVDGVGAKVRAIPLSFDENYQIDLDVFAEKLSPRTRLVSLASPQNPVGVAIPAETVKAMVSLMERVCPEAYLLLDASYREAAYGNEVTASAYLEVGPKVVSCASLSKSYGAPGLRLGWVVTTDPVLQKELVLGKYNTVIACSLVDEFLALKLMQKREAVLGNRRALLAEGLVLTEDWVAENEAFVDWIRPDAGAFCCVRLKSDRFDDAAVDRFYEELANRQTRVADGAWFGMERRVFRLGFGALPMNVYADGLEVLSEVMRKITSDQ